MLASMAVGLAISTSLTVAGLIKIVWPATLIDRDSVAPGDPPTAAELRQSRNHGLVMVAFGVIGLYAILTWDGTPAEFFPV